ncbi:FMN-binding negative transcriptional regulator [Salegentibacter sp.]|uniref:FMN-binding negative transcriptional regulator n=1 Tax=Salegentibacter sp. TaxID=1903072 RepID=UPI0035639FDC
MYQPKKYKKKDPEYIFKFIQNHPFATFILKGERLLATHIPVLIEGEAENFRLYGHIANHNEQFQHLKDNTEALLIFQGAHGYISSSWYKEKDISTWDYSAVHVNVRLKLQSQEELEQSLINLVHRFEKDQEQPLEYRDIPSEIISDHLPLITGFWCEPFKMEGIAKLHQGYDSEDLSRISKKLQERDEPMDTVLEKNIRAENETKDR